MLVVGRFFIEISSENTKSGHSVAETEGRVQKRNMTKFDEISLSDKKVGFGLYEEI